MAGVLRMLTVKRRSFLALVLLCVGKAGAQSVCDEDHRPPAPQLGVGLLQCVGGGCDIFGGKPGAYEHTFTVEPRLLHIGRSGPAAGILQEGDRLVAVAGNPITSRRGGRLLAQLIAGVPLQLTIRRNNVLRDVSVTPRVGCGYPILVVTETPTLPAELNDIAEPGVAAVPSFELGVTLACDGCRWTRNADGTLLWKSLVMPRIATIEPNGPAARAGLAVGDYLLTIDGRVVASETGGKYLGTIKPGQRLEIGYSRNDRFLKTILMAAAAAPPSPGTRR